MFQSLSYKTFGFYPAWQSQVFWVQLLCWDCMLLGQANLICPQFSCFFLKTSQLQYSHIKFSDMPLALAIGCFHGVAISQLCRLSSFMFLVLWSCTEDCTKWDDWYLVRGGRSSRFFLFVFSRKADAGGTFKIFASWRIMSRSWRLCRHWNNMFFPQSVAFRLLGVFFKLSLDFI